MQNEVITMDNQLMVAIAQPAEHENGNIRSVVLPREWRWCGNVHVQSGVRVVRAGLAWNKTINHDFYLCLIKPCLT